MENQGLYVKYDVRNAETGELISDCFVLRPDKDPIAVKALMTYRELTPNIQLQNDLSHWLRSLRVKMLKGAGGMQK